MAPRRRHGLPSVVSLLTIILLQSPFATSIPFRGPIVISPPCDSTTATAVVVTEIIVDDCPCESSSASGAMPTTVANSPTSPSGLKQGNSASGSTFIGTLLAASSPSAIVFTSSPVPLASSVAVSVSLTTATPSTIGTVLSELNTNGRASSQPFNTVVVPTSSATLSVTALPTTLPLPNPTPIGDNIFVPISNDDVVPQIPSRGGLPISKVGVLGDGVTPLGTNKFYAQLMFGTQRQPVWTLPYSLQWLGGSGGNSPTWGMAVSHIDASQFAFGPGSPASYFATPNGINSIIFNAAELGSSSVLTTSDQTAFSVKVNLAPSGQQASVLTLPLVQGMGFVTGIYTTSTPLIQSDVLFMQISPLIKVAGTSTWKFSASLQDGKTWLVYVTPSVDSNNAPMFTLTSSSTITGPGGWSGYVQVAKLTGGTVGEAAYDASAGVYPLDTTVSASVGEDDTATYKLTRSKGGQTSRTLLMFALPHHSQSFDAITARAQVSGAILQTPTKGMATMVIADAWSMVESLPTSMSFNPWSPTYMDVMQLPEAAQSVINSTAAVELSEDFVSQSNLDSMYFSGKALTKFAMLVYVMHELADNPGISTAGLAKLKAAYDIFVQNSQQNSLVYDTVWGGVVTADGYTDINANFGNTGYNDHHFHYGYFVYAAAVIAHCDPSWMSVGTNSQWVNMLVRDYANPVADGQFPFSRNFDWFNGHSWAKGLFESGAGKDQESSSEDTFASYAIKMWGYVTGDASMEARGNLMLAIQARSLSDYYLLTSNNQIQPQNYIGNKALGILFEGKADHTTYFGTNIEYIEGIHMLPLAPNSGLTRPAAFVQEEWDTYFSNGRADTVAGGWRGILYANLAFIDPKAAWNFFAQPNFDNSWLDGGASRTWYLALTAALGGVD